MKILHITPHIGGGIGKVLSGIVKQSKTQDKYNITHQIICLEKPDKLQFITEINNYGKNVIICPSLMEQENLIKNADIIQLELFDSRRPTMIRYLQNSLLNKLPIRLIVWYHNNGLYDNFLPDDLVKYSHIFLFTSPCSFQNKRLITKFKNKINENNLSTVFSSGGFETIPETLIISKNHPTIIGYFKHLNPAKLFSNIDEFIYLNNKLYPNEKLRIFENFIPDIIKELKHINVIAYLLHPFHFGCSENLLLECMAMGIVPIVLDNPAEQYIVRNYITGLIIKNINDFENAIKFLYETPEIRQELGLNAARDIRERFSIEKTEFKLNQQYNKLIKIDKEIINLNLIDWKL